MYTCYLIVKGNIIWDLLNNFSLMPLMPLLSIINVWFSCFFFLLETEIGKVSIKVTDRWAAELNKDKLWRELSKKMGFNKENVMEIGQLLKSKIILENLNLN